MNLRDKDLQTVRDAVAFFENPDLLTRGLSVAGNLAEKSFALVPAPLKSVALKASDVALRRCMKWGLYSLEKVDAPTWPAARRRWAHSVASGVTGAVSGLFGPAALALELPITTTILMRSIASSAQQEGFDLKDPAVLTECLFVFSLGGPSSRDDGMNSSYFGSRMALAGLMREAAAFLSTQAAKEAAGLLERGAAPALVRLIAAVAEFFGLRVAEKFLLQLAPVLGSAGGAAINFAFCHYFTEAARHHFALRRLSGVYGDDVIKEAFEAERFGRAQASAPT